MTSSRIAIALIVCASVVSWSCASGDGSRSLAGRDAGGGESLSLEAGWQWDKEVQLAVDYLIDNQHEDGSFGHFLPRRPRDIYIGSLESLNAFGNASTALCLMGLLRAEPSPEVDRALSKGFAYLANHAKVDKKVNENTFYNTWSHTYMIEAFVEGLADERLAKHHSAMRTRCKLEIEQLYKVQSADGGFGYYDFKHRLDPPSGNHSTSFNTAAALIALQRAKETGFRVSQERVDNAMECLLRHQQPNNAFVYGVYLLNAGYRAKSSKAEGSLTRSQCCVLALKRYEQGGVDEEAMGEIVQRLFDQHEYVEIARQRQFPHETWFDNAPYYYYFGHYYAAHALSEIPQSSRTRSALSLAWFIARTQDKDGSFWDYPLYGYTKAYGTGYALVSLLECKRHLSQSSDAPKVSAKADGVSR